ncbi:MAG: ATP-binding protein [Pelagimonas sp.]|uniref:ATP-binding protein n=1 Tax=Pelagimonas sp. TaxID=2073170 RepID=UPI003D6B3EE9
MQPTHLKSACFHTPRDFLRFLRSGEAVIIVSMAALIGVFLLVSARIWAAEEDAYEREKVSVTRVFESYQKRLLSGLERYAASNAAYQNIDTKFNPDWIENRLTNDFASVSEYSATFLVSPNQDVVYKKAFGTQAAALDGVLTTEVLQAQLRDIRNNYLELLPKVTPNSKSFSSYFEKLSRVGVIQIGENHGVVSAFAIVPDPGGIPVTQSAPYILVTVHLLDDAHVLQILNNLSLEDLSIARNIPVGKNGVSLAPNQPHIKAFLVWTPMSKGTSILLRSAPVVLVAIGMIFSIALFFIRKSTRTRLELLEGRRQLNSALEAAKMNGFLLSSRRTIQWRDDVQSLFGAHNRNDLASLDRFCEKIVHPDDREALLGAIIHSLENHTPLAFEFRAVRPNDGEVLVLRMHAQVLVQPDRKSISLAGVIQDISEYKLLAEKLRQSQKMEAIGNLTGGIAHDFNNLLGITLGNLELLKEDAHTTTSHKYVDTAIGATNRAADLTQSLLTFARKAPLTPKPLDLNESVRVTQSWATRVLPANVEVETSLFADLWTIDADHCTVENTLLNLILNARDAMQCGGKLTIETENLWVDQAYLQSHFEDLTPGRYVMLAVTDTGSGISKTDQERIFEPFFTTKELGKGTGLGLASVQGFMKQSGGMVQVYSELGYGTTFKLYFPARSSTTEVEGPKKRISKSIKTRARILVAEDEPELRKLKVQALEAAGHDVISAHSGDHALKQYETSDQIDLLLTDIVMPGDIQGPKLAEVLREKQPNLKVVFMSGYPNGAALHMNELQAEDIRLSKPIKRNDLLAAIESALSC